MSLAIGGMHCATCAQTLHMALSKAPGISNVTVNFASEQAMVVIDPDSVTRDSLAAIVSSAGFSLINVSEPGVTAINDIPLQNKHSDIYKMITGFTAGFILMLFGMKLAALSPWLPAVIAIPVFLYTGLSIFSAACLVNHLSISIPLSALDICGVSP